MLHPEVRRRDRDSTEQAWPLARKTTPCRVPGSSPSPKCQSFFPLAESMVPTKMRISLLCHCLMRSTIMGNVGFERTSDIWTQPPAVLWMTTWRGHPQPRSQAEVEGSNPTPSDAPQGAHTWKGVTCDARQSVTALC